MVSHIVRVDGESTHGWQARISLSDDRSGKYHSKFFSDTVSGGKLKAKRQADEYLRTILKQHGIDHVPKGRRKGMKFILDPSRVSRSNLSGRTGVYRGEHERTLARGTQQVRYWAASYTIGPKGRKANRSRRFYFGSQRTEEEARTLATRFREQWEEAFLSGGTKAVRAFFKEWRS